MEWLIELIYVFGLIVDLGAWFKSRDYRKERKRWKQTHGTKRNELYEPIKGKEAWVMFVILTPILIVLAVLWVWLKGWALS